MHRPPGSRFQSVPSALRDLRRLSFIVFLRLCHTHARRALLPVDATQQQAFFFGQDSAMLLRLVRAQVLRALGRRAEAAAALESVAALGSEVLLPLHSLRACVVRCRHARGLSVSRAVLSRCSGGALCVCTVLRRAELPRAAAASDSPCARRPCAACSGRTPRCARVRRRARWSCCARRGAAARSSRPWSCRATRARRHRMWCARCWTRSRPRRPETARQPCRQRSRGLHRWGVFKNKKLRGYIIHVLRLALRDSRGGGLE